MEQGNKQPERVPIEVFLLQILEKHKKGEMQSIAVQEFVMDLINKLRPQQSAQPQILTPPPIVFEQELRDKVEQLVIEKPVVPLYLKTELTDKGMVVHYEGLPYPKKGFPYPQAIHAVNLIKKDLMTLTAFASKYSILPFLGFVIMPHKWKIKLLEKILFNRLRFADWQLAPHYLKPEYMSPCPREIRKFLKGIMVNYGFSEQIAAGVARVFSTLIQYDDTYQFRVQDIFSETNGKLMLEDPIREVKKLMLIYSQRESALKENDIGGKFLAIGKLALIILRIPKIRKAFKKALEQIDFSNLQLDEADRYYCLNRSDYNFFGKPIEDRIEKYKSFHPNGRPRMIQVSLQN